MSISTMLKAKRAGGISDEVLGISERQWHGGHTKPRLDIPNYSVCRYGGADDKQQGARDRLCHSRVWVRARWPG